ncbi:MAG TPA: hypothetical protein VLF79_01325 [Candidatus Saccharimonadales bacterium]|nr:hypothetical protein [Candidatus Saccharimonadales bacterium]
MEEAETGTEITNNQLQTEVDDAQPEPEEQNTKDITWTASEFVAHDKSAGWYGLLALTTIVLAVAIYLLFHDVISVAVVVFAGLLFGFYAGHQPRQLNYSLNSRGLNIGEKHYNFDHFRWFSIVQEGAFSGVLFMPHKRFAPTITVYYPPEEEDQIMAILTSRLPVENHKADAVDSLMKHIRF